MSTHYRGTVSATSIIDMHMCMFNIHCTFVRFYARRRSRRHRRCHCHSRRRSCCRIDCQRFSDVALYAVLQWAGGNPYFWALGGHLLLIS